MKKNLILVGMMGVGRTTLGKIVAKKNGFEFIDTDLNIEKKNSMTIKEIFEQKGEKFFRAEEEKEVLESLKKTNAVIALGGGSFLNKTLRNYILKDAVSFWLDVDIQTLNERIKWSQKRPLLNIKEKQKKLSDLYTERKDIYKEANYKIECGTLNKEIIVEKIINLYEKH